MDYLSSLLEDCKSETLMLMTPRDGISRRLKSAADFDTVWERFPPFDYRQIRSVSLPDLSTNSSISLSAILQSSSMVPNW
ncbi:hypothetical protein HYC85_003237 [Camellia sinensis]|uniref:Uncharacterized protein n=1 Tax=Camellia sinensis TaxID=4442 RepID=A0A7J7ICV8_CAMSI|nr:hypothetical protein HYC85_003237 [Camellia sinensis]